jgi:hypothetical protein
MIDLRIQKVSKEDPERLGNRKLSFFAMKIVAGTRTTLNFSF